MIFKTDFWKLLRHPLIQFSKLNNFLWVYWFLRKNLSNFVPPVWKLHNPYCHKCTSCNSNLERTLFYLVFIHCIVMNKEVLSAVENSKKPFNNFDYFSLLFFGWLYLLLNNWYRTYRNCTYYNKACIWHPHSTWILWRTQCLSAFDEIVFALILLFLMLLFLLLLQGISFLLTLSLIF